MTIQDGERSIEQGVRTDFSTVMDYAGYLDLDTLLSAQHRVSDPPHHDELLFIIQHQTTELWFTQLIHELRAVRDHLDADRLTHAIKGLARVKTIQRTLAEQWSILGTLTPVEYAGFRRFLGESSGFQSYQYRVVEFMLGNKHERMMNVFQSRPERFRQLQAVYAEPTVYDAFLRLLARRGYPVPVVILERDVTQAWVEHADLVPIFQTIYENEGDAWDIYEACEALVDLEDAFQIWRFRHLRTVQRIIGYKPGTGGSSGVEFLKRALDLTFFPELITVRTQIRDVS